MISSFRLGIDQPSASSDRVVPALGLPDCPPPHCTPPRLFFFIHQAIFLFIGVELAWRGLPWRGVPWRSIESYERITETEREGDRKKIQLTNSKRKLWPLMQI